MRKAWLLSMSAIGVLGFVASAQAGMCMFGAMGGTTVFQPPTVNPVAGIPIMPVNPASAFSSSGASGTTGGTVEVNPTAAPGMETVVQQPTGPMIGPMTPEQYRRVLEYRQQNNFEATASANRTSTAWEYATTGAEAANTIGKVTQQTLAFIPGPGATAAGALDIARGTAEGAAQAYADGKSAGEVFVSGTVGGVSNFISGKVTDKLGNMGGDMVKKGNQIMDSVVTGATTQTIEKTVKAGTNIVVGTGTTAVAEYMDNTIADSIQTKVNDALAPPPAKK